MTTTDRDRRTASIRHAAVLPTTARSPILRPAAAGRARARPSVARRATTMLAASALALVAAGCGVSPRQSDEPASARCTGAGTTCVVHLIRGAAPQEFGHGKDRFALRLGPARDRTVQIATRKGSDGRWFFNGGFGSGSGSLDSKVSDVSVGRIDVDSAEARVVFHRGRAN